MKTHIKVGAICAFFYVALPGASSAQVTNGNFSNGGTSWQWKKIVFESSFPETCANAPYVSFIPNTNSDTPSYGAAPAVGRVARIHEYLPYSVGTYKVCRQIEQLVWVQKNQALKFDVQIGEGPTGSAPWDYAQMAVSVIAIADGVETTIWSQSGASVKSCYPPLPLPCPAFTSIVVGLNNYNGQWVKFIFRGATSHRNNAFGILTHGSPAFIDNIRIEYD